MLISDGSGMMLVAGGLKIALGPLGPLTGLSRDFELDAEFRRLLRDALLGSAPYCGPFEVERSLEMAAVFALILSCAAGSKS
jgi:hypothetical protein